MGPRKVGRKGKSSSQAKRKKAAPPPLDNVNIDVDETCSTSSRELEDFAPMVGKPTAPHVGGALMFDADTAGPETSQPSESSSSDTTDEGNVVQVVQASDDGSDESLLSVGSVQRNPVVVTESKLSTSQKRSLVKEVFGEKKKKKAKKASPKKPKRKITKKTVSQATESETSESVVDANNTEDEGPDTEAHGSRSKPEEERPAKKRKVASSKGKKRKAVGTASTEDADVETAEDPNIVQSPRKRLRRACKTDIENQNHESPTNPVEVDTKDPGTASASRKSGGAKKSKSGNRK